MPLPAGEPPVPIEWLAEGVGLVFPPAGYAGAASLLIDEGSEVVLVDAGLAPEQRRSLAPHVDVCLLTHCHVAHAHGAADFQEVWAPRDEAAALASLDGFLETYDVARRDRAFVSESVQKAGYAPTPVAKRLQPGSIIRLDKHEWHLLHAPGHSQGMLALLEPVRHILFVADMDGEGSAWYGYPSSDPSALESTAQMLAEVPVAILATSHAPARRRGIKPMFRQLGESVRERDRKVLTALEQPRSLDELVELGLCAGKPRTPVARYHERVMVEKHLGRLLEKDYVGARQDGRFQRAG